MAPVLQARFERTTTSLHVDRYFMRGTKKPSSRMRLQKIISVREDTTKLRGNNKLKRGPPWIDGSLGYRSKFWLFYG